MTTLFLDRTEVRGILIGVSDEHVHVTEGLLADIDKLPITTDDDAREAAAKLVDELTLRPPWKDHMIARAALMLAARAIRRGRHLTDEERMENLAKFMAEQP